MENRAPAQLHALTVGAVLDGSASQNIVHLATGALTLIASRASSAAGGAR